MLKRQRALALCGALLFAVGMVFGLWAGAALSGVVALKLPRLALAVHLNGLMGGLWLLAVAFTFPFLAYGDIQLRRLALLVAVPAWANVFITLAASVVGYSGLGYNGIAANDTIAALLQLFVVLPSLVGSVYWVRGFLHKGVAL